MKPTCTVTAGMTRIVESEEQRVVVLVAMLIAVTFLFAFASLPCPTLNEYTVAADAESENSRKGNN